MSLANLEAEQALLGALLTNNAAYHRVSSFLRAEHFAEAVHGRIFQAISKFVTDGRQASPHTLREQFDRDPALESLGGGKYLGKLSLAVVSIVNSEDFGRTIYDLAVRRRLVEFSERIRGRAEDEIEAGKTADEIVSDAVGELSRMASAVPTGMTKRAVAERVVESLKQPRQIYSTGLPTMDTEIGGGLISGKLYGIAARKKVGKTIILGTISHNLNSQGVRHGFLSMEMSADEIEQRNIAREGRFNSIKFLTRDAPWIEARAADYAVNVPNNTIFEHKPGVTFDELRRILARSLQRKVVGWIIDYWQLVGGKQKNETEEQHLRNVAQFLADFARRENVFVLTAAQVNQEGNTRGGEGLKLACDMYFTLHREKDQEGAWLQMEESRFTTYADIGTETMPGVWLHKRGPHFSSDPPPMAPMHDPRTGEVLE